MADIWFCDMSALGKLRIHGEASHDFIRIMSTADPTAFEQLGGAKAGLLLTGQAEVIDVVVIIRTGDMEYMVITAAPTAKETFAWLEAHAKISDDKGKVFEGLTITDETDALSNLVLFGTGCRDVLDELTGGQLDTYPQTGTLTMAQLDTVAALIFDTPVVPGEAYELFIPPKDKRGLINALLSFPQIDPLELHEYQDLRKTWGTWFSHADVAAYTFPHKADLMSLVRPSMDFVGGVALQGLLSG